MKFFITVLALAVSLGSLQANDRPYGSGTLPLLERRAHQVALVKSAKELKRGQSKYSAFATYEVELQTLQTLPGSPKSVVQGPLLVQGYEQPPVLTVGALVFIRFREADEEGKGTFTEAVYDARVEGGDDGVISEASDARLFKGALEFVATPVEKRVEWALRYYSPGDQFSPFDRLGFSARVLLETIDSKNFSEAQTRQLLKSLLEWHSLTFNQSLLGNLARAPHACVREELEKFIEASPALSEGDDKIRFATVIWLYLSTGEDTTEKKLEEYLAVPRPQWNASNLETLRSVLEAHRLKWTEGRRKFYEEAFSSQSEAVRLAALEALDAHGFYRAGPPFAMVGARLALAEETVAFKERAIGILAKYFDGLFHVADCLGDQKAPLPLRKLALKAIADYQVGGAKQAAGLRKILLNAFLKIEPTGELADEARAILARN